MFRKYTIVGESNPVWQLVEPSILTLWANGMLKSSYTRLYLVHFVALFIATAAFGAALCLRVVILSLILGVAYFAFENELLKVITSVLSMPAAIPNELPPDKLWLYQLTGYMLLITAVTFVFGGHFVAWVRDVALYLLMIVTFMAPLMWIARGLLQESYLAQLIAKSPFMGSHIPATIAAAPPDITKQHDRLIELYQASNDESKRKELEELCATDNRKYGV